MSKLCIVLNIILLVPLSSFATSQDPVNYVLYQEPMLNGDLLNFQIARHYLGGDDINVIYQNTQLGTIISPPGDSSDNIVKSLHNRVLGHFVIFDKKHNGLIVIKNQINQ